MVALWDHKTEVIQSILVKPDTNINPKVGKEEQARNLWVKRGKVMLPQRIRLNTVRTIVAKLENPALGSAWIPCRPKSPVTSIESTEKAFCTYFNSSIGVLAVLGGRSSRVLNYPWFSMDDLNKLLVPNFPVLGDAVVDKLAAAYDKYAEQVMLPLPQMNQCPVRLALDEAVAEALNIDGETVATSRRQLAMEPSITGKRYAGPGG